ncbi:MAG: biliverdin-producing heme oxygenase [Myxococcota bacterium]
MKQPFLTASLRDSTDDAHRSIEGTRFARRLLASEVSLDEFSHYMAQLLPVYDAMESVLSSGLFGPFSDWRLHRASRLRQDLKGRRLKIGEASLEYATAIESAAERSPLFVLGHAYVRYFGDVTGGAVILRRAQAGWSEKKTWSFFDFGEIGSSKKIRGRLSDWLNRPELESVEDKLIREANKSFVHSRSIFEELEAHGKSAGPRVALAASS